MKITDENAKINVDYCDSGSNERGQKRKQKKKSRMPTMAAPPPGTTDLT